MKKSRVVWIALAVVAAVGALVVVGSRCGGRVAGALSVGCAEGEMAERRQEAEKLARVARDLRVLARRYKENGEAKKAQRAVGAAQELDRKIARLLKGE